MSTSGLNQIQARLASPTTLTFDKRSIGLIRQNMAALKEAAVNADDQEEAKQVWCAETILTVQELYVTAFDQLKAGGFYPSWCTLEKAEIELSFLSRHHDISIDRFHLPFIDRQVKRWQSLFPYRLFLSPELLETEKKCSICNQVVTPRRPCGHDVGEIYNGMMCSRIVTGLQVLGISVVTKPLQKYSVLFMVDKESGGRQDHYNYVLVNYASERLQSPWHGWSVETTHKCYPHSRFVGLTDGNLCPCNSGDSYGTCCHQKEGVLMPHYEFTFEVPPPVGLQNNELHW